MSADDIVWSNDVDDEGNPLKENVPETTDGKTIQPEDAEDIVWSCNVPKEADEESTEPQIKQDLNEKLKSDPNRPVYADDIVWSCDVENDDKKDSNESPEKTAQYAKVQKELTAEEKAQTSTYVVHDDQDDDLNSDLIAGYVVEGKDRIEEIEPDLLDLDSGEEVNQDLLNRIFRAIHTMKGSASFLQLYPIVELTHVIESILVNMRDFKVEGSSETIDSILGGVDKLKEIFHDIESIDEINITTEMESLQKVLSDQKQKISLDAFSVVGEEPTKQQNQDLEPKKDVEKEEVATIKAHIKSKSNSITAAKNNKKVKKSKRKIVVSSQESVRVNVGLLSRLMNLVGELVLGRNQLKMMLVDYLDELPKLERTLKKVDVVTAHLQENIMKTRMQAISSVFKKIPRMAREISKELGKQVDVNVIGGEVELDKTIVDGLSDPLTHIIRNSLDHGIEVPEERVKVGKNAVGRLEVSAFHEAGQVNIVIKDDGGGIDFLKVVEKALSNGTVTMDELKNMSDKEKLYLIFLPGLSTSKEVSNISGRGVGMDVVKTSIESLGGHVELISELGKGTELRITLPLTLAIVPSLIVTVEKFRFAIPQVNIQELVRIRKNEAQGFIEKLGNENVLRLREHLLPLVQLSELLDIQKTFKHPTTGEILPDKRKNLVDRRSRDEIHDSDNSEFIERSSEDRREVSNEEMFVVVNKFGSNRFGILVDSLLDSEEIVVKPLSKHLKKCRCFSGSTIMGDGSIAMILDPAGIVNVAGLTFKAIAVKKEKYGDDILAIDDFKKAVLMFNYGIENYYAFPLAEVSRIQRIKNPKFKNISNKQYICVQDNVVELICLDKLYQMPGFEAENKDEVFIIYPKDNHRAILASQIQDVGIVQDMEEENKKDEVFSTKMIHGKPTSYFQFSSITKRIEELSI